MLQKALKFFNRKIWDIPLERQSGRQKAWLRFLRIIALAVRGFREDKIGLRASALTFFTLLAVVPLMAMIFGIAKGFGLKQYLIDQIHANFSGQQEILNWIINFANSFLDNAKGGIITGIGLVILLWSVLKVFSNIESSFNAIWQIQKSRSWFRKFSDYFSFMFIAPIMMIVASSATVFIKVKFEQIADEVSLIGFLSPLIFFLIRLIPYVLIWGVFTFLYMFMPNIRVKFRSALIAGIAAGTIFVLTQWVYINFQVGVSRYSAIYGSFAALPLFIVWLQISWLIILLGAEISFADQNLQQYEFESDIENISAYSKKILALIITHLLVKNFSKAERPLTAEEISHTLKIPMRLVRKILFQLVECRILSEIVSPDTKERAYQPGQDIDNLTIIYVLNQLDHLGKDKILSEDGTDINRIKGMVDDFNKRLSKTEDNKLLKEI
jgi:membrane protein